MTRAHIPPTSKSAASLIHRSSSASLTAAPLAARNSSRRQVSASASCAERKTMRCTPVAAKKVMTGAVGAAAAVTDNPAGPFAHQPINEFLH